MALHHINQSLEKSYCYNISNDETQAINELHKMLKYLQSSMSKDNNKSNYLLPKDIGKVIRMITTHVTLKYNFTAELVYLSLNTLSSLYYLTHLRINMKVKILSTIINIIKKNKYLLRGGTMNNNNDLSFVIEWEPLWNQIIELIDRHNRHVIQGSERILSELLTILPNYLHTVRNFLPNNETVLNSIVNKSMSLLEDISFPSCCEGVLLLLHCLPTWYPYYEKMLPKWIEIWLRISNNIQWDCCWLTIFTRARKHSKGFVWNDYLPLLFNKVKLICEFPVVENMKSLQNTDFPHCFNNSHIKLMPNNDSTKKITLKKLAKLIHFAIFQNSNSNTNLLKPIYNIITLPKDSIDNYELLINNDGSKEELVLPGATEIMKFLQSLRIYFYAGNYGGFTSSIAFFYLSLVLQLCRHIGHSAGQLLINNSTNSNTDSYDGVMNEFYSSTLHLSSVKYLLYHCYFPYSLEGFYSKIAIMSQSCLASIKNIIAIAPELGDVVLPLLMSALNPSAVNQPHQLPIAIQGITICFHCLLYPKPIIMKYLMDILKLSLAGIDASDNSKTLLTLNLYSTIFGWLPIYQRGNQKLSQLQAPNFLSLAIPSSTKNTTDGYEDVTAHLEELYEYIDNDWSITLLDRIFLLLEAQEEPQDNTPASPIASAIGQCLTYVFQSLSDIPETNTNDLRNNLRQKLQNKIMLYFTKSTPINAVKASAKIMEAMVESDVSIINAVLLQLLDNTVATASCGSDKLAFRIRLIGGVCRGAGNCNILSSTSSKDAIIPIVTSSVFFNHNEKKVREATRKLLKDLFKGSLSFYPTSVHPVFSTNINFPPGAPNMNYLDNIAWHRPCKEVVEQCVAILKVTAVTFMENITTLLQQISIGENPNINNNDSTASSDNSSRSVKKLEELIINQMWMIEKALRGAAEIFGDILPNNNNTEHIATTPMETSDSNCWDGVNSDEVQATEEADNNTDEDEIEDEVDVESSNEGNAVTDDTNAGGSAYVSSSGKQQLLSTGREELLNMLNPEDKEFLTNFRIKVLGFLYSTQSALTSVASTESQYAGIKNSIPLQQAWLQIFNIVVTRRMAILKDVDNVKRMMKYATLNGRCSFTNVVYKTLKRNQIQSGASDKDQSLLLNVDYWRYHDVTTSMISCKIWMQYALRCKELSFASVRICADSRLSQRHTDPFMKCVGQVIGLCQHEYDKIRGMALQTFDIVSSRFGVAKLTGTYNYLISMLRRSDLTYPKAKGIIALIDQRRVVRRLLIQPSMCVAFLRGMLHSQQTLLTEAVTSEEDKKSKLASAITDVLVKYFKGWSVTPIAALISDKDKEVPSDMVKLALAGVGYDNDTTVTDDQNSNTASNAESVAVGLRFETFAAYLLLHNIGREEINLTSSLPTWKWSLKTVTNGHGHPSQAIALAALIRLAQNSAIMYGKGEKSSGNQQINQYVRDFLSPSSPNSNWKAFIKGIAQTHPKTSEDGSSAQWSKGIQPVLNSASFLKVVLPRSITAIRSERNLFSSHFRKEDVALYIALVRAGMLDSVERSDGNIKINENSIFYPSNLSKLFAQCKDEDTVSSSANEGEVRAINTTKAEMFAGLLFSFRSMMYNNKDNTEFLSICSSSEQVFLDYFKESIESLSLDYCKDWEESLCFAFQSAPIIIRSTEVGDLSSELFLAYATNGLKEILRDPNVVSELEECKESDKGAESFTSQAKIVQHIYSLLIADLISCYNCGKDSPSLNKKARSMLAPHVLRIMLNADHDLISQFRVVRREIAYIICVLIEIAVFGEDETLIIDTNSVISKLVSAIPIDSDANDESSLLRTKNAAETICTILQIVGNRIPLFMIKSALTSMLSVVILGAGKFTTYDIEISKLCHDTCLIVANACTRNVPLFHKVADKSDTLSSVLILLQKELSSSTLLHSRETCLQALTILMVNNWDVLDPMTEIKICKDVLSRCIDESKPEIWVLAQRGMIAYLSYKQPQELAKIASIYTKNSEVFAAREKKKKRLNKDNNTATDSSKIDNQHRNTVLMMSCVLQALPYDLPSFVPELITSFIRHSSVSSLHDVVIGTVQTFKRKHQDRWEKQFKLMFTSEQLTELQGTGAGHYYC